MPDVATLVEKLQNEAEGGLDHGERFSSWWSRRAGQLKKATLNALAAAQQLAQKNGGAVEALGRRRRRAGGGAGRWPNTVPIVHFVQDAAFDHALAETHAAAVAEAAKKTGATDVGDRRDRVGQGHRAARRRAARRRPGFRRPRGRGREPVQARDVGRQRHRHRRGDHADQGRHRPRHRVPCGAARPAARCRLHSSASRPPAREDEVRRVQRGEERAARARPRRRSSSPAAAAPRATSSPSSGSPTILGAAVGASRAVVRRRLAAQRPPGRPDRQGGRAQALHRRRHLRRHPAPRRHEGLEDHRRHQQGPRGAHLPGRRLRAGGRSVQGAAGAVRGSEES